MPNDATNKLITKADKALSAALEQVLAEPVKWDPMALVHIAAGFTSLAEVASQCLA